MVREPRVASDIPNGVVQGLRIMSTLGSCNNTGLIMEWALAVPAGATDSPREVLVRFHISSSPGVCNLRSHEFRRQSFPLLSHPLTDMYWDTCSASKSDYMAGGDFVGILGVVCLDKP